MMIARRETVEQAIERTRDRISALKCIRFDSLARHEQNLLVVLLRVKEGL
jgi:hypothetical protein